MSSEENAGEMVSSSETRSSLDGKDHEDLSEKVGDDDATVRMGSKEEEESLERNLAKECSHNSGEERLQLKRKTSAANLDSKGFHEDDSGAGSDDSDLHELAETGGELCQVGNVTCSIPYELYDLSNLEDILSVDVWNECLTEEERFNLSAYLPDLDEDTFMLTMKELFEGRNFHFGSPVKKLFDMLKGGLCDPRSAVYLEARNFLLRTKHYHSLRKYHNDMVVNFCKTRDTWSGCEGYSIDEKLRVLSDMKRQETQIREENEYFEEDSSEENANAGEGRNAMVNAEGEQIATETDLSSEGHSSEQSVEKLEEEPENQKKSKCSAGRSDQALNREQ